MKRNNGLLIATIIICAVILGSMFFPLLKVDFSSVMDDSIPFAKQLQEVSDLLESSGKEMTLDVSGKAVLSTVGKGTRDIGSLGKELMLLLRLFVLTSCVCAVLIILFSFFQKMWAKVLSVILSAVGCIITILQLVWILPSRLSSMIADRVGDTVSAIVTQITEASGTVASEISEETVVKASEIRKLVLRGVRPALWVTVAAFGILLIISILRICLKDTLRDASGSRTFTQPSFQCSDGPLAGETIPIGPDDEISFGNDPAYANMVIQRDDIAPLHCRISYNQEKGKYKVQVLDDADVLLKGKKLKSGECDLKRGSEIFLGPGDCSILLL